MTYWTFDDPVEEIEIEQLVGEAQDGTDYNESMYIVIICTIIVLSIFVYQLIKVVMRGTLRHTEDDYVSI